MNLDNKLRISIVTVSFNQRTYLKEAIESVLNQNYPSLEYIVVDPGSNDGSRELIQKYSDAIAHVVFEKDQGAADGLNKGFARANGDVFGFLNSDDRLTPGSLQQVTDFFHDHPECDILFGNGYVVDGAGKRIKHVRARGFTLHRYFHGGARWLQQSTFFRREAFQRSPGFNLQNRTCWDGELFMNIIKQGARVGYTDVDLGEFRIYAGSISGAGSNTAAYRADLQRMFNYACGRDWRITDTLWKALYRLEGLAIRSASVLGRRKKR